MRKFLRLSVGIVCLSFCGQFPSMAMDSEDINFSACQKIFHTKLTKLNQDITKFPSIFIAYGWGDEVHERLVDKLNEDLKRVGFDPAYDLDVRLGGLDNKWTHADKILTSDKVIVVGSQSLKEKYKKQQGRDHHPRNIFFENAHRGKKWSRSSNRCNPHLV